MVDVVGKITGGCSGRLNLFVRWWPSDLPINSQPTTNFVCLLRLEQVNVSCFETNKQLCTQYYLYAQANSTIHTDSAVVGLYHGTAESGEEVFEAK
jgi:hypothetical protein